MTSPPYLLHLFNSTKNASPFDINMAYEAGFHSVIPYTYVMLEDIYPLTQDTIFSRGPTGVKRTSIFIGGREFGLAIDMLHRSKAAMVPPFEVSVFTDPSGAITTAASIIACIGTCLKKTSNTLANKTVYILGTGPVGICSGILAASCGAKVSLVNLHGNTAGEECTNEYNRRFNVNMQSCDGRSDDGLISCLKEAEIIINAAKAGIQILHERHLTYAKYLMIAADANAVPPAGIAGIGSNDMGNVINNTPNQTLGIGALAIGDLKYKVHYQMLQAAKKEDQISYMDHNTALNFAQRIIANHDD